jgi:hypothetical protein
MDILRDGNVYVKKGVSGKRGLALSGAAAVLSATILIGTAVILNPHHTSAPVTFSAVSISYFMHLFVLLSFLIRLRRHYFPPGNVSQTPPYQLILT